MAEAGSSNTSFSNICPFCDVKLNSQFLLGKHLLEVHNICVNTNLNKNNDKDVDKEQVYFTSSADSSQNEYPNKMKDIPLFLVDSDALTLGNKMKTLRYILKENFSMYTEKLKDWINCDISRTEFDQYVRPLFNNETIVIHNEFLICFLKEIRSINQSSMNIIKQRSNFASHTALLSPAERPPAEETSQLNSLFCLNKIIADDAKNMKRSLPDEETMYALALVHAWENGCTAVNKKVVPVLHSTAETIIKIIRDAVMIRRKTLKIRQDGFIYDTTKVDPKSTSKEDPFLYTGDFDVAEIIDALKAEPSLIPFKALSRVISEIMNFERNKAAKK